MENVKIETTQNVAIELRLASVGERIAATLLDWLILAGYAIAVTIVFGSVNIGITSSIIQFVLLYLPVLFYHLLSEVFLDGQSLGKKQMNIKVVKEDGSQPTLGSYLLRWVFRLIDIPIYGSVALISILITKKGQRLGDLAAKTTVIRLNPKINYGKQLYNFPEDYVVTFPQVTQLQDKDIQIIRESIHIYRTTGNAEPMYVMTRKVKELLGIDKDMESSEFLKKIIQDYNFMTSNT